MISSFLYLNYSFLSFLFLSFEMNTFPKSVLTLDLVYYFWIIMFLKSLIALSMRYSSWSWIERWITLAIWWILLWPLSRLRTNSLKILCFILFLYFYFATISFTCIIFTFSLNKAKIFFIFLNLTSLFIFSAFLWFFILFKIRKVDFKALFSFLSWTWWIFLFISLSLFK